MSHRIRCGVIGAGSFAEACHVPGLQSHPQAEVVALCGRRADNARRMADRLGIPDVHTDYRELVARDDVDAVSIATPNVSHAEIAIAALEAGKHVLSEKPLAMNGDEAAAMRDAATRSGLVNMVAFTFRYLHSIRRLRELIADGEIGPLLYVRLRGEGMAGLRPDLKAQWRDVTSLSGGGMVADIGSHYLDVVNWAVAPVSEVCGVLLNVPRVAPHHVTGEPVDVDADALNAAFFRTQPGVLGDYMLSRITPKHGDWGLEVVGERGALMAFLTRGEVDELRRIETDGSWENVPLPAETATHEPLALGRMMRSFVDAILRGAPEPGLDGTFEDGYRAQLGIDAVIRSAAEKRRVTLPT